VAVNVATAIGLTLLDSGVIRPGRQLEPYEKPSSGVTVRTEVLHAWLPDTLLDAAGHQSLYSVVQTQWELRTCLKRREREDLWYALTVRCRSVNGGVAHVSFIRHPYREPQILQ
jgi:hypothetical protein